MCPLCASPPAPGLEPASSWAPLLSQVGELIPCDFRRQVLHHTTDIKWKQMSRAHELLPKLQAFVSRSYHCSMPLWGQPGHLGLSRSPTPCRPAGSLHICSASHLRIFLSLLAVEADGTSKMAPEIPASWYLCP